MKKRMTIGLFLFCAFSLSLGGCRTTNGRVNTGVTYTETETSYNKPVHKLFILAELPNDGWNRYLKVGKQYKLYNKLEASQKHAEALKTHIEELFGKTGIECSCEVISGLELDESVYDARMAAFAPDAYVVIDCVSITMRGDKLASQNYDISLFDYPSRKRVWRAQAAYYHMNYINGVNMALKLYNAITIELKDDGLDILATIEPDEEK